MLNSLLRLRGCGGAAQVERPIRIVLADDHPVVRRGMQALLESESDLCIAGIAADGLETVRLRSAPPHRERSDRERKVFMIFASSNAWG